MLLSPPTAGHHESHHDHDAIISPEKARLPACQEVRLVGRISAVDEMWQFLALLPFSNVATYR